METRERTVRLTARIAAELETGTGMALDRALEAAFRRGLGLLSGREPLRTDATTQARDAELAAVETEAAEMLNTWRVLARLADYEALDASVDRLEQENRALRPRMRVLPDAALYDQQAAVRRLFGRREGAP